MNSSKKLSVELYKLSGWEDDTFDWWGENKTYLAPRYSLGYLLRKLQTITDDLNLHWSDWWVCSVKGSFHKCSARANIPENAACLLAIKLFETGVLK